MDGAEFAVGAEGARERDKRKRDQRFAERGIVHVHPVEVARPEAQATFDVVVVVVRFAVSTGDQQRAGEDNDQGEKQGKEQIWKMENGKWKMGRVVGGTFH